MSIEVLTSGISKPGASIFVTGLSQTDTVTATNGSKTLTGKWTQIECMVEAKVPTMTSNTAPSGECSVKSAYGTTQAYYAFSGSPVVNKTAHSTQNDAQGWWIAYDFGYPVTINYFEICPQFESGGTYWNTLAKTLTLQGSNDGSTWNDIQDFIRTDNLAFTSSDTHKILKYTVDNPATYSMFRVVWTTLTSTAGGYSSCSYVQFVGEKTGLISGHMIKSIRDLGTWTVTASAGTDTYAQDVLVDVITEYEIEITKKLYLYRDGDECEDVTGGWLANNISNLTGRPNGSVTKNEDSVYLNGSGYTVASIVTSKKISKIGYEKIFLKTTSQSGYCARIRGMSINSGDESAGTLYFTSDDHTASTGETVSVDITSSSIPDEFYVVCFSAGNSTSTVTQIWLE